MKRLTERDEYGNADIVGVDSAEWQGYLSFESLNRVTEALNRLAHYEDLDEQGRLKQVICDVGDTVWDKDVEPWNVISIEWFSRKVTHLNCVSPVTGIRHTFSVGKRSLGKTVFLSREEAEAAIGREEEREEATP